MTEPQRMTSGLAAPTYTLERVCEMLEHASSVEEAKDVVDVAAAAVAWAKSARQSVEVQNTAAAIQLRAERKAGGYLADLKRGSGNRYTASDGGRTSDYAAALDSAGVTRQDASRWRKLAELDDFEERLETVAKAGERLTRKAVMTDPSADGFNGDEYGTPSEIIELARELMGSIDLDPASNDRSQKIVQAEHYLTKEDNGLEREWFGNVWLNPPYSTGLVDLFIGKLLWASPKVQRAVALVNASVETGWFQALLASKALVLFLNKRLAFLDHTNQPRKGNRYAQAIFFLGDIDQADAERVFGGMGQFR